MNLYKDERINFPEHMSSLTLRPEPACQGSGIRSIYTSIEALIIRH